MPSIEYPIPVTKSDLYQHWKERMTGNNLHEITVRYKDTDYFEQEDKNLDPETVIYETVVKESSPKEGHLNWGNITLYPGRVNDQYFCTHGHIHSNPHTEEYILTMEGDGLIMLMNDEGDCWCEVLEEGSLHHIDEGLARRLINLGDTPLQLSFCYPSNTELDYDALKERPFPCHVYEDDGEMAIRVDVPEEEGPDALNEADILAILKS